MYICTHIYVYTGICVYIYIYIHICFNDHIQQVLQSCGAAAGAGCRSRLSHVVHPQVRYCE